MNTFPYAPISIKGLGLSHYHCLSRVVGREFLLGGEEKEHFVVLMRKLKAFHGVRAVTFCEGENRLTVPLHRSRRGRAIALQPTPSCEQPAGILAFVSGDPTKLVQELGLCWLAGVPPVATAHQFQVFVSGVSLIVLAMRHGVLGYKAMGFNRLFPDPAFGVFNYEATRMLNLPRSLS